MGRAVDRGRSARRLPLQLTQPSWWRAAISSCGASFGAWLPAFRASALLGSEASRRRCRSLDPCAGDMTAPAPALATDLEGGLRGLRLGAMRRLAPELLVTAKTQRWSPEEFLRTSSKPRSRHATSPTQGNGSRPPGSPSPKPSTSSTSPPRRSSPRRSTTSRRSNGSRPARTCVSSAPPGPAKASSSSPSVTPRSTPETGPLLHRGQARRALYRGLDDNSVGRVIGTILRADVIRIDEIGFAPLDPTGAQLFFWLVAGARTRCWWGR